MKKVLITGASGFVGGFLAEYLLSLNDYEIVGTYHSDSSLESSPVKDRIHFSQINLLEAEQVDKLIDEVKPEYIFHLAAASSAAESFKNPSQTINTNINSEINLFEAVRKSNLTSSRILIVSSAEVYGYVKPEDLPVNENTQLRPASPYAVSKIAQDYLAFQYVLSYKFPIIRARPFNHIGPRQASGFVTSDFGRQIAAIEKGQQDPVMKVGNLEAKRDFTDVRDIVRAYILLIEKGNPGEVYNIGSGTSRSIQSILDMLLSLSTVKITTEVDSTKMRPSDIPDIVCDHSKLTELTGWKPEIPLEQTIKNILDYWRNIV